MKKLSSGTALDLCATEANHCGTFLQIQQFYEQKQTLCKKKAMRKIKQKKNESNKKKAKNELGTYVLPNTNIFINLFILYTFEMLINKKKAM